ncbi:MAG TPA: ABC transporter ATP-binding protein [Vicinamibacteria bacterium]|nr:ABC transporter ATP-binding protein [Vicinamibacteria bacterium]
MNEVPAVSVEGLTRRFRTTTAIDDIRFTVRAGELFGLVGPDGAGKTTVLRVLAGVLPPTGGDAAIRGVSVARDPERVKHEIGYMSQRFGLYADLTVLENLMFYADLYQVPRSERPARLKRLFHFSNLEPFQDRLAGKLSGGMKQKLGLSCALIHEPKVLLLDEPTFGVDPISRRDLWLIVHEMVARGVTVVVSTSYLDEAERFDRLALLHRGRVLEIGSPADLLGRFGSELLAIRVDRVREARQRALEVPRVQGIAVFGGLLHVAVPSAAEDGPILVSALRGAGFSVESSEPIPPSLEDVFIEAVSRAESR